MKLKPFRIEQYYNLHEFTARYMLSSSDAQTRPIEELLAFEPDAKERLLGLPLGYTEAAGAPELREAIAAAYQHMTPDDVLAVSSAEEGIFLVYQALLGPGDHAVVETPCYESALELARSTGAEVSTWQRHSENGWAHDLQALEAHLKPTTKVLYINTPHNPTGLLMLRDTYRAVLDLCREHGITLFCDEVYRELEHDPADRLPAACDELHRAVSLGSISKTYGLPGLRTGWLASRDHALLERVLELKYYTSICSPGPSELLAAVALRHREVLAERNRAIVHRNLPLLDGFFERHAGTFAWARPNASPIGFARVVSGEDVDALCERIVRDISVLLLPGTVYDAPGHVRFGYGRANMPEALSLLDGYLGPLI